MKPLIIKRDKHIIEILNQELGKKVRYNLKIKQMEKQNKGGVWIGVKMQYPFFQNYSINDIECEEEKFKKMIEKTKQLNPGCKSVSTFVSRLNDALVYENYITNGIETECSSSISYSGYRNKSILTKPIEFYTKNVIKFFKHHNIIVTCELENCFIKHKRFMEKLIDKIQHCGITDEQQKDFIVTIGWNGDTFEYFQILVERHKYDIKNLISYLFNYLFPFENINFKAGLNELKDYYEMANTIGRDVKKYPKYLRSMHDIITANYNSYKRKYDELLFKKLKRPELEIEEKEFCIVIPTTTKDIVKEGTDLNHCVSSYVDRILKRETYIFFLRKKEDKKKSLVTLEIKGKKITNAKGSYNRLPTKEETEFLKRYSKKLNIQLSI